MIDVVNICKKFGNKVAVDNLSFSVAKGEVLGFLGPNGAGKSTTMRMVTGYLPPTSGTASIGGADIVENEIAAKSKMGYLPENAPLYTEMTVRDFLRFSAELRGVPKSQVAGAVDKAVETCFLERVFNQSIDTLSKGYRHRTCLAQSIIHDPEVLILDEPTDGLDPNQKHEVRQLIKRMGKDKAIIFSTHILEEVEASCTRAIIIDRGRVIADGTPDSLKARARHAGAVLCRLSGLVGSGIRHELEKIAGVEQVEVVEESEKGLSAHVFAAKARRADLSGAIYGLAKEKNLVLHELHTEDGRLDDLFREITKRDVES